MDLTEFGGGRTEYSSGGRCDINKNVIVKE